MIKILIGGSPCTFWSIAQTKHRETEPSGMGWELFKNYLIAKEKFKPDFFLYENNVSADPKIKAEIRYRLDVDDGTLFGEGKPNRYIEINSALVSAQNRQRFYVHNCGDVGQPEDRHIMLKDILETGVGICQSNEKSRTLKSQYSKFNETNFVDAKHFPQTAVAMQVGEIKANGGGGGAKTGLYAERIPEYGRPDKSRPVIAHYYNKSDSEAGLQENSFSDNPNKQKFDYVAEPMPVRENTVKGYTDIEPGQVVDLTIENSKQRRGRKCTDKCHTLTTTNEYYQYLGTKKHPIYEVKDGHITINGKQYPIKLKDGKYIIRKLTVTECCRLQTMPDHYCDMVSKSQAYKALGNGWTAEVIIHILKHALFKKSRDEKIVVLSMYDGIATGRYCLDRMGFTNVEYYAFEIDKSAIKIAKTNYPDIIECGDAFQVRDEDFDLRRFKKGEPE